MYGPNSLSKSLLVRVAEWPTGDAWLGVCSSGRLPGLLGWVPGRKAFSWTWYGIGLASWSRVHVVGLGGGLGLVVWSHGLAKRLGRKAPNLTFLFSFSFPIFTALLMP